MQWQKSMLKTIPVLLLGLAALSMADNSYDYLKLAIQWPPGACSGGRCISPVPEQWTVHGLWPQRASGGWPEDCYRPGVCPLQGLQVLDDRIVPSLKSEMETHWPSLFLDRKTNEKFWEHEYCNHGTCCDEVILIPEPDIYFSQTLQLHADITDILETADITPRVSDGPYRFEEVEGALKVTTADFQCRKSKGGRQLLSALRVCLDKTSFALINCPDNGSKSSSCDKTKDFYLTPETTSKTEF